MKILCISDKISEIIYSNNLVKRFNDIDLILSCGDLPFHYYEFIMSTLNKPLYYVMGNHEPEKLSKQKSVFDKFDTKNITGKIINFNGIIIGGLSNCKKLGIEAEFETTEMGQQFCIYKMLPKLWINKIFQKRYIDILISHSPPLDKNDDSTDYYHSGFKAYTKFLDKYMPKYHIHGHIHLYDKNQNRIKQYKKTTIINAYEYYVLEIK